MNTKCPICDGSIVIPPDTIESEIIQCPECSARLVIEKVTKTEVILSEAPKIEEDWGE